MRRNRAKRLAVHLSGLAILLSLGLVFVSAQAQAAKPPVLDKQVLKKALAKKRLAKKRIVEREVVINGNVAIKQDIKDLTKDKDANSSGGSTSILPQPDRETLKRLKDARYLIKKERFGEAVRILGDILSSSDDSFLANLRNLGRSATQVEYVIPGHIKGAVLLKITFELCGLLLVGEGNLNL